MDEAMYGICFNCSTGYDDPGTVPAAKGSERCKTGKCPCEGAHNAIRVCEAYERRRTEDVTTHGAHIGEWWHGMSHTDRVKLVRKFSETCPTRGCRMARCRMARRQKTRRRTSASRLTSTTRNSCREKNACVRKVSTWNATFTPMRFFTSFGLGRSGVRRVPRINRNSRHTITAFVSTLANDRFCRRCGRRRVRLLFSRRRSKETHCTTRWAALRRC